MKTQVILKEISTFLFPIKCINCGSINENYICINCSKSLEYYKPECFITRKRSIDWSIKTKKTKEMYLEKVFYFYKYNHLIHNLFLSIKYLFHKDKINECIKLLTECNEFKNIDLSFIDLITYVPISSKRENWRGFNQSKLIAKGISENLKIPFLTIVLKTKNTKPQIELNREKRLKNVARSFELKQNLPVKITNQNILIIDDVFTTGATLNECAKVIKTKFPDTKIYGMCLARGE